MSSFDPLARRRVHYFLLLVLLATAASVWSVKVHSAADRPSSLLPALPTPGADAAEPGSYLEARVGADQIRLPALAVDYRVQVHGDLAEVTVVQTFRNPLAIALAPRYLFPLPERAAVSALVMTVGEERVVGRFARRAAAERTFAAAEQAGKVASLLRQERPNQFTQRIANLMPGAEVRVELTFQEALRTDRGMYELVLPLVVGPRFETAGPRAVLDGIVPAAPVNGLTTTAPADRARVQVAVDLQAPVPVLGVDSPSHALAVTRRSAEHLSIALAAGRVPDNRDFVLRYQLGGADVSTGVQTHFEVEEGGYFSLLIEPPASIEQDSLLPREMVFLLDCSGSMSGLPMQASKRFMRAALETLRPQDSFRIIRFSDRATTFAATPQAATAANIAAGIAYTESLRGSGGTVMTAGIYQALAPPVADGVVRTVVFLTDGYIGNEAEILQLVATERQTARLYAFGVGAGVNRYLLETLARTGAGFARYLDPTDDADEVAEALAARLAEPLLTELAIDWGALPVTDVVPAQLPDLYAGQSVRIQGRYRHPAVGRVELKARSAAGPVRKGLDVVLDDQPERPALRQLWARARVGEEMHLLTTPPAARPRGRSDAQLREAITVLGERYGLVTRWTALVAVAEPIVQSRPHATVPAAVAVPAVAGVSPAAYGTGPLAFSGAGTPEPGIGLAMALLGFLGLLAHWRLRRWHRPEAGRIQAQAS
ncbi:MAG: VIT and VWA domain-containing protein [Pseudomonadota bacterium]